MLADMNDTNPKSEVVRHRVREPLEFTPKLMDLPTEAVSGAMRRPLLIRRRWRRRPCWGRLTLTRDAAGVARGPEP